MEKLMYALSVVLALGGLWLLWQGGTLPGDPPLRTAGAGAQSLPLYFGGVGCLVGSVFMAAVGGALSLLARIERNTRA